MVKSHVCSTQQADSIVNVTIVFANRDHSILSFYHQQSCPALLETTQLTAKVKTRR